MVAVAETPDLPIRMLHDRLLVAPAKDGGERKSSAGILIPATASVGKRLAWGTVAAAGPLVRQVELGDSVLFDPQDLAEVELEGAGYVLLRERDVHAIAESATDEAAGLYL
ncbi:co-chaperone GroES [Brevibacterium salitolerans]|uniref:10 kDa chaperonin n=2 Tax=Brevibacteriaceae TaxID=85019 RepID=A0ABP5II48_9MICO